jgi:type I restriction enzyme S subunit
MNSTQLLQHFDRLSEAPDAIARLRRFILDLAVRGKLVEQDPNDEPAAELLKRIQAEKERLGLTPRRQGAKKSGKADQEMLGDLAAWCEMPYSIPTNWEWVPLGLTVNTHFGGGTPSKNNFAYWDGDIFWASVKDIGKGKYVDETIDRITEAGLANSSSNLIPPGNLIVVTRMGLGKVSINRVPVAINQDLRALSLSTLSAIDYYYNFLKTHAFEGSGLTVKGIKVEELLKIPFPLPPLAEQHRIVTKVDELMALCDRLQAAQTEREQSRDRLVAASLHQLQNANDFTPRHQDAKKNEKAEQENLGNLAPWRESIFLQNLQHLTTRPAHIKQLRQTILNLAIQGFLLTPDTKEAGRKSIQNKLLDSLVKVVRGSSPRPKADPRYYGGNVPRLLIADITRDGKFVTPQIDSLTGEGAKLSRPMPRGSLVLAISGSYGVPAFLAVDACIHDGFIGFRDVSSEISEEYLFLVMLWRKPYFDSVVKDSGLKNLTTDHLKNMSVPVPSLAVQNRIVAKVDELMALCDQLEAQLTTTEADSRRLLEAVLHEALASPPKAAV